MSNNQQATDRRSSRLGLLASAFSPWHPGYCWAMQQAVEAEACDGIFAAMHVDPSVERPDKRRPVLTLSERLVLLRSTRYVQAVCTYTTEAELRGLIRTLYGKICCLVVGEDHRHDSVTGGDLGVPIFWVRRRPEWSGTEFTRRIYEAEKTRREAVDAAKILARPCEPRSCPVS